MSNLEIYHTPSLPQHFVVEVDGQRWLIPNTPQGWERKTLYRGNYELRTAAPFMLCILAHALGIPMEMIDNAS